jgi:hypothetical protein
MMSTELSTFSLGENLLNSFCQLVSSTEMNCSRLNHEAGTSPSREPKKLTTELFGRNQAGNHSFSIGRSTSRIIFLSLSIRCACAHLFFS